MTSIRASSNVAGALTVPAEGPLTSRSAEHAFCRDTGAGGQEGGRGMMWEGPD